MPSMRSARRRRRSCLSLISEIVKLPFGRRRYLYLGILGGKFLLVRNYLVEEASILYGSLLNIYVIMPAPLPTLA
jgi:hypothetical protein